ncbi:hypothetical protein HK102_007191 [Quaeritorhiza haematococci]|nr:hypothetical protein HK102_007191 [Quaeritorhiza haematococci]
MAEMDQDSIVKVINTWSDEYQGFAQNDKDFGFVKYVQIFENKGAIMGCSNPHPHGQIWATEHIPEEPSKEFKSLKAYRAKKGTCLLCDYAKLEMKSAAASPSTSRIVCENDSFVCVCPFWAVWPYETMVLSKTHVTKLPDLTQKQKEDLADVLKRITCRYDNVFGCSFPYSMGIHQAPVRGDEEDIANAHLHLHFYPPLLRSPTVKKFLVGYEMMAEPQRDLTAEQSAARLRECSEVHYKQQH